MSYYSYTTGDVQIITALNAISEDTTSSAIDVTGAKAIAIQYTEAGSVNNRSGVLSVTISPDASTFSTCNMLIDNVTNTNSQTLTRVATKTRATVGTDIVWLSPEILGALVQLKVAVDVTDGASPVGTFTVKVIIYR